MSLFRPWMIQIAVLTFGLVQPAMGDSPEKDGKAKPEKRPPARTDLHGDPLPEGAIARMGTFRFRHGQKVSALAVARDGKTIASASDDKMVRLWQIPSGKEMRRFTGPGGHAWSLAFSPDVKLIAWSTSETGVEVWDLASAKKLCRLPIDGESVSALAFSPDGKTLATNGRDNTIRVWDLNTGRELHRFETSPGKIEVIAFSPTGKLLAYTGQSSVVRLLNVASGKEVAKLSHSDSVLFVGFAGDDRHVVTASWKEATVWELAPTADSFKALRSWTVTKGERRRFPRPSPLPHFSISPDGQLLAMGSEDNPIVDPIRIWEIISGKEIATVLVRAEKRSPSRPIAKRCSMPTGISL